MKIRTCLSILMLFLCLHISGSDLHRMRELYGTAYKDEIKANQLLDLSQRNPGSEVLRQGYQGAAKIIMAKHVVNPFTKWDLFRQGKNILEAAIASNSSEPELRYLRLTIQLNAPAFLGYKDSINEDRKFLLAQLDSIKDIQLKKMIMEVTGINNNR